MADTSSTHQGDEIAAAGQQPGPTLQLGLSERNMAGQTHGADGQQPIAGSNASAAQDGIQSKETLHRISAEEIGNLSALTEQWTSNYGEYMHLGPDHSVQAGIAHLNAMLSKTEASEKAAQVATKLLARISSTNHWRKVQDWLGQHNRHAIVLKGRSLPARLQHMGSLGELVEAFTMLSKHMLSESRQEIAEMYAYCAQAESYHGMVAFLTTDPVGRQRVIDALIQQGVTYHTIPSAATVALDFSYRSTYTGVPDDLAPSIRKKVKAGIALGTHLRPFMYKLSLGGCIFLRGFDWKILVQSLKAPLLELVADTLLDSDARLLPALKAIQDQVILPMIHKRDATGEPAFMNMTTFEPAMTLSQLLEVHDLPTPATTSADNQEATAEVDEQEVPPFAQGDQGSHGADLQLEDDESDHDYDSDALLTLDSGLDFTPEFGSERGSDFDEELEGEHESQNEDVEYGSGDEHEGEEE